MDEALVTDFDGGWSRNREESPDHSPGHHLHRTDRGDTKQGSPGGGARRASLVKLPWQVTMSIR